MKKVLVLAAMLLSMNVIAETIITTGGKNGTYFPMGHNLKRLVGDKEIKVIKSKGSRQNLERVAKGEATIGFAQADDYLAFKGKNPSAPVEIIGTLYQECIYVAVKTDGKISTEDDLGDKNVSIAVGKRGSGSAITWDYARQLEDSYTKSAVVYEGGIRTLAKVSQGVSGYDAFLWVTRPEKLNNKFLKSVLKNDSLTLLPFDDYSVNNDLDGKKLYTFRNVDVVKGTFNDTEYSTACMNSLMIINSDIDEDLADQLADITLNYKNSIIPQVK